MNYTSSQQISLFMVNLNLKGNTPFTVNPAYETQSRKIDIGFDIN